MGKYADTAIPALLPRLERRGGRREQLQAFLVGGANMFQASEDSRIASIGEKNVEAVQRVLAELAIPIVFEDTGGVQGRTVCFDNDTGELAGEDPAAHRLETGGRMSEPGRGPGAPVRGTFERFRTLIYEKTSINMREGKHILVSNRLRTPGAGPEPGELRGVLPLPHRGPRAGRRSWPISSTR